MNVAVTNPTAGSFLTVWPAGEPRPLAASLNMVPGQTVPNLVFARLGNNGKVSMFNNAGDTDIVADILGVFSDNAAGRFVPLTPRRVLDTREGLGAPQARIGQTPLRLPLTGVSGIPAAGVTAVLFNMTAVAGTESTFIVAYPSGTERPLASNLNAGAGQVVPNMVIGNLGADGSVDIFNNSGLIDLVADVVGYFTGTGS